MPLGLLADPPDYWVKVWAQAPPSNFETALRDAPDFEAAVRLAARRYRQFAAGHARTGGSAAGTAWWHRQADDAGRVLALHQRLGNCPTAQALFRQWLIGQGLAWYLSAWEEGTGAAFARELGF